MTASSGSVHRPRQHSRGDRYVVLDDVLSPQEFNEAVDEFKRVRLKPGISAIDPVFDGFGYRSGNVKFSLTEPASPESKVQRTILKQLNVFLDVLTVDAADLLDVTFTAWGYPSGSRLSWHNDSGPRRLGAFVFFVHPTWSASWGGELTVVDTAATAVRTEGSTLLHSKVNPTLILPRPNRLVIFQSNTMHCIQRVDSSAGDRLRQTYSGFVTHRENAETGADNTGS